MTTSTPPPRPPDLGIADIGDLEQVARGGFGVVYRGRQERFRRTVAIKVLDSTPDAKTLARFEQECQALGALSGHPNIVPVFDAGSTPDGRPFLIMPYLPGGSLADLLAEHGRMAWRDVLDAGVKLAGALTTAHEAGLLHRDIKPENVLRSPYGEPLLADFGLARVQDLEMSQSTTILATPAHVAPEVISGRPASVASDVYSLGSALFSLAYGSPAFVRPDDEHVLAVMARLASEPPPDLRPLGVPDLVCRVLEWCMQKEPVHRPATARAFGEALQRAQAQLGVPVTPLPVVQAPDPHAVAQAFARSQPSPAPAARPPLAQPSPPLPSVTPPNTTPAPAPSSAPAPAPAAAPARQPLARSFATAGPSAGPRVAGHGEAVGPARTAGVRGQFTPAQVVIAVVVLLAFLGAGVVTGLVV